MLFTVYAKNTKVGPRWIPLLVGLPSQVAVEEMVERQDRVRRSGQPCRFAVRPDGEGPPDDR